MLINIYLSSHPTLMQEEIDNLRSWAKGRTRPASN